MRTMAEFRLLVLDSLKYIIKVESPINRPAKAAISRNLIISGRNHLLFYFLLFSFLYLFLTFYFIFHLFPENRH